MSMRPLLHRRPAAAPRLLAAALLASLATGALAPRALAGTPAPETQLATRIAEVTVYGTGARVVRQGSVPGGGEFVIAGLPAGIDTDSLRVRLSTGHVVSVEALARVQAVVPDARMQELRAALAALLARQREVTDQRTVAAALEKHLLSLTESEKDAHAGDLAAGRPSVEAWRASLQFVNEQLTGVLGSLRGADEQLEQLKTQLADAQAALGEARSGRNVQLLDVHVDVVAEAPAELQLEYLIGNAGWEPLYDLRTAGDGTSVALQYRARVHQRTGEDWNAATVSLSTAQPQRGAQGPEPQPLTVSIFNPAPLPAAGAARGRAEDAESDLKLLGYLAPRDGEAFAAGLAAAPPPFAEVIAQGLSVQFRLPRAETIVSRDQPTTVLVGEQDLAVTTEHYVTPALDTTVWLRGRATNGTPWTLLPGTAAVYFGNDFIGNSRFEEPVLPEQEFTLHLGADPGVVVTREQTQDLHEEPGFLGRRQTQTQGWRVKIENVGAHAAAADGSVA
ncbi:MAG TPA: mucoidy inhibitor MuiA family protein, partial [Planctomycetota bacterium]|nr:mucoidy inhibitor MuiA family protein [Planctomycetota bacterium]